MIDISKGMEAVQILKVEFRAYLSSLLFSSGVLLLGTHTHTHTHKYTDTHTYTQYHSHKSDLAFQVDSSLSPERLCMFGVNVLVSVLVSPCSPAASLAQDDVSQLCVEY